MLGITAKNEKCSVVIGVENGCLSGPKIFQIQRNNKPHQNTPYNHNKFGK